MTQPQQPFGEGPLTAMLRSHALADADLLARARRRAADASPAPLRETADPVDAAELLKQQAAQIGALQVRVGVQDARIAALDDDCRRLRAEVERLGQAQAV